MKLSPYKIIVSFFIILIFSGTILISLPLMSNTKLSFIDRVFTITSAVCVTGLSVVDISKTFTTLGQVVILFFIQIGGLGYMVLASLIIILFGKISLGQKSIVSESLSLSNLISFKQIVPIMKQVLIFTLIFELLGSIFLGLRFYTLGYPLIKSVYYGIFHSISAFCNAGFSLFSTSFEQFKGDVVINIVVPLLIISGGLGFIVWINIFQLIQRKVKDLMLHTKIVLLTIFVLILFGIFIIYFLNVGNIKFSMLSLKERILVSWFQAVTPRTAGFNTFPIKDLSELSIIMIMGLMFIGASPGSTGGGIKTTTFFVIVWFIFNFLKGEKEVAIFKRRVNIQIVIKSFVIFLLSTFFVMLISSLIHIITNISFRECLFETVSAFGTVGLSLGITSNLDYFSKILLITTMLFGRVGSLTLFTLLFMKEPREVKFLEEDIAVG